MNSCDELRSISELEQAAIGAVLCVDFDGVEELRKQIPAITSVCSPCGCGCGTIGIHIDERLAPPSPLEEKKAPVEALFIPVEDGVQHDAGLILWVDEDGYMGELEVYSSTHRGVAIPELSELSVYHRDDPANPVTYHDAPSSESPRSATRRIWSRIRGAWGRRR